MVQESKVLAGAMGLNTSTRSKVRGQLPARPAQAGGPLPLFNVYDGWDFRLCVRRSGLCQITLLNNILISIRSHY